MSAAAANLCHTHKIPMSNVICMNDINTIYINAIRSALVNANSKRPRVWLIERRYQMAISGHKWILGQPMTLYAKHQRIRK